MAGFGGGGNRHFKLGGHLSRPSGEADLWGRSVLNSIYKGPEIVTRSAC